jgi:site-specific recombinase XerD
VRKRRPRTAREVRLLDVLERDLRRRGATDATRACVARSVSLFLRAVTKAPRRIDRADVERFLAARARQGLSSSTRHADLVRLRILFRAFEEVGLVTSDPTEGLPTIQPSRQAVVVVSEGAVERLLAAATERLDDPRPRVRAFALRDRACLELLYSLALRQSEIVAARLTDLDLGQRHLVVRSAKRGRTRTLPIPEKAVPWIERWLREGRPLLVRAPDDGRLILNQFGRALHPVKGVHIVVQRIARRAGSGAHPHALRRAAASHLVRAGVSVPTVQTLLGHRQLATTAAYVDVYRDELRRAADTLDRLRR